MTNFKLPVSRTADRCGGGSKGGSAATVGPGWWENNQPARCGVIARPFFEYEGKMHLPCRVAT